MRQDQSVLLVKKRLVLQKTRLYKRGHHLRLLQEVIAFLFTKQTDVPAL